MLQLNAKCDGHFRPRIATTVESALMMYVCRLVALSSSGDTDKELLAMLQLDHHCPWTGKCIGKRTIRVFYVFLGCITAHIVVLAITVTMTYVTKS